MKKLRKIVSLLLAVVMMMSLLAVQVMADTADLTIEDTTSGATYSVYKILDVTVGVDSQQNTTYAYTVPSEWVNFFTDTSIDDVYVDVTEVNGTYYVTWKSGVSTDTASMQKFGELIQDYIDTTPITATDSDTGNGGDLTFTGLELGYYYVTTSAGSLVVIDTVSENVTIADKNAKPTVEKKVSEDDTNYSGKSYTDISETVYYQVTIEGIDEITVLVLHDDLPSGFELNTDSVTVTLYSTVSSRAEKIVLTKDTDYTVNTSNYVCSAKNQNGFSTCDFEVDFTKLLAEITSGNYYNYVLNADEPDKAYIVVSYTASITDASAIKYGTATGNVNAVALTTNATAQKEATTTTYTYDFYVYKYDSDNSTALAGAEFTLYDTATSKYATFEKDSAGDYYLSGWVDSVDDADTVVSDSNGLIHVYGLDVGSYTLTETKAPDGYAMSSSTIDVTIDKDSGATGTSSVTIGTDTYYAYQFANSTSAEMPSTGGIGVTIFYVLGGVIVVAAVVSIVVLKKRTAKVSR